MLHVAIALLLALGGADDGHGELNPLFRELLDDGVAVSGDMALVLPEPTMPDGLGADSQRAVIETLAGDDYSPDQLLRQSVVAPQILRMSEIDAAEGGPARRVDFWFVAYGELETLSGTEFLDSLLESSEDAGTAVGLTADELADRGISIAPEIEELEAYGHVRFPLLKRVDVSVTGRSFASQTDESLLAAARVDPRFANDAEFPNEWRPLVESGEAPAEAAVYEGGALYLKITRLVEPAGALFVECHLVFSEPQGWFDGANTLGSKLPPVVQSRVRSLRRELLKASRAGTPAASGRREAE
jgi:hypothetical protein